MSFWSIASKELIVKDSPSSTVMALKNLRNFHATDGASINFECAINVAKVYEEY